MSEDVTGDTNNMVLLPQRGLHAAIVEVMKASGWAKKSGTNEFHKYAYTTEADAITAVREHMVSQGLYLSPSLQKSWYDDHGNVWVDVEYTLMHAPSGQSMRFNMQGCGNDRAKNGVVGDKALYKACTGASKYALLKLFLLATGDDPEASSENDRAQQVPQRAAPLGAGGRLVMDGRGRNGVQVGHDVRASAGPQAPLQQPGAPDHALHQEASSAQVEPLSQKVGLSLTDNEYGVPNPVVGHTHEGLPLMDAGEHPQDGTWALVEATFMAFVPTTRTMKLLQSFWMDNIRVLEDMKEQAPDRYVVVRDAFTKRKEELS